MMKLCSDRLPLAQLDLSVPGRRDEAVLDKLLAQLDLSVPGET
jgi:hypothetical protein